MGMTVEEYRKRMMDAFHNADCEELIALVVSPTEKEFRHLEWLLKTHYKIPKEQYETRLKADLVAMLTEIQLEIEELDSRAGYDGNGMPTFSTDYIRKKKVNELIQQKINALMAESKRVEE